MLLGAVPEALRVASAIAARIGVNPDIAHSGNGAHAREGLRSQRHSDTKEFLNLAGVKIMSQIVGTALGPRFALYKRENRERSQLLLSSILIFILLLARVPMQGQTSITTWHYDNARTSANTTESLLTPSNVNSRTLGKLFTQPVDGYVVAQPLYLPGTSISGQGTHNVIYVATM